MGLLQPFSEPPPSNQNPWGGKQNSKHPWAERDIGRNAPGETQENGHHTSLCVNNGYTAREAQFSIDFDVRIDTHVEIRKWRSKVVRFTTFVNFSNQNALEAGAFKTKCLRDLPKFGAILEQLAAQSSRKKWCKTQVRGTS